MNITISGEKLNNFSLEELRVLANNGIIDEAIIEEQIKKMDNKQFLDKHSYRIWQASDGFWKTKLPDKKGKFTKLIKKKHLKDLEDVVIGFYKTHIDHYDFETAFQLWMERQSLCGRSDNTIYKYTSDYNRFFKGYPIEKMDIRDIEDIDLTSHIRKVLEEKPIPWKALQSIWGYVNGIFNKAIRDRVIRDNPCNYVDLPMYRSLCKEPSIKTARERTLSMAEQQALLQSIHNPVSKNANKVVCFAIELSLLTGMRVGEISGLKWEDILYDEGIMLIRHSEKHNRLTNEYTVSTTKTGKDRIFPLSDELINLFNRIKEYEISNGLLGEFVFMDKNGRISSTKISDSMRNRTGGPKFSGKKSIHAIRRTFNSNMKCNGVSTTITSSLLGNSERVNSNYYTYDVSDMALKREIIEKAGMICSSDSKK